METVRYTRLDWESRATKPTSLVDISDVFSTGVWPENAQVGAWCMLKAVSLAKKVISDRLHVGISCALIQKECDFLDNSYAKNSSVYRHSFRSRFPMINFLEPESNLIAPD